MIILVCTTIMVSDEGESDAGAAGFVTTHWSVILAAADSRGEHFETALRKLCCEYWLPLYAYVRRNGYDPDTAKDLTQGFFEAFLTKRTYAQASAERGRFRTFLLTAMKNFLANRRRDSRRQKRGGSEVHLSLDAEDAEARLEKEIKDPRSPDESFDRQFAVQVLNRVLGQLADEYARNGLAERFRVLSQSLEDPKNAESQAAMARQLGMTEAAVKSACFKMRQRFRQLYRMEIGRLVEDPSAVDREIQHLLEALSR